PGRVGAGGPRPSGSTCRSRRTRATARSRFPSSLGPPSRPEPLGGVHDGVDDGLVAGAAAEVARDRLARFLPRRRRGLAQDLVGAEQHPGRAEPALEALLLPECLLHGVELAVPGEALDRRDLRAVRLDGEGDAGAGGPAVDDDRAGAADAVLATCVSA